MKSGKRWEVPLTKIIKIKKSFGDSCTVKSITILGVKRTVTVKHIKTMFGLQSFGGLTGPLCLVPGQRWLEVCTQWGSGITTSIDLSFSLSQLNQSISLFFSFPLLLLSLQSQALSLSIRFFYEVSLAGLLNSLHGGFGLTKMQKCKLPGLLKA